ncbi:Origin recognition complex subunit 3 [Mortierella claussenii]|nr:Origin recognition complex subunit 3 [Mortierella claussenii]
MDEFDSLTEVNAASKRKHRGKGASSPSKGDHFVLDGFQQLTDVDEPWEATELRHSLFNKEWGLISSRIESVMLNMNTMVLSAIYRFVDAAYTPKVARAAMPIQELPTGLIFAGINVPDHDILFQQIAQVLSSATPPTIEPASLVVSSQMETMEAVVQQESSNYVVVLQSKDCANLKAALKSMIEQFLGLGITGAIDPFEGGLKLQNHDMLVLERWYQSLCDYQKEQHGGQQTKPPTLVVIIQDFESFDQDTLQDLVMICSSYQDRISFVFLMGLATSIDALHQGLPKSVLSLLQTRKFQMQQSSECLTAIIEDLFIHTNVSLMVGSLPLKQLIDQFMHYNFSVGGFVANLKYIVMHHFYANPLSVLCDRTLTGDSKALEYLGKGHFDHIRMLPSFQQYVERKVEVDQQVAEMLLLDNEFLALQIPDMVKDLEEYHRNFALVFDFLWFLQSRFTISVLKKSKRALYFMALEGTLAESSNITFLLSLVRKMNSNDMMLFIEDCLQFFKDSPRCSPKSSTEQENAMDRELVVLQSIRDRMAALLDVVSEDSVTSSSEIEDNDQEEIKQEGDERREGSNDQDGEKDEDGDMEEVTQVEVPDRWTRANGGINGVTNGTNGSSGAKEGSSIGGTTTAATVIRNITATVGSTFVKKRKLVSVNANAAEGRQTRIARKTRETARLPKGALGTYTVLVTEVDQLFTRLFKTYLVCHTTMPLNEVFYYSQVKIQQKAFLPQPRASIQTALGQPELYLNCECCHPPSGSSGTTSLAELVLPTQHDTCILYKLYVECGRMINMYDWFTAFGMILERGISQKQGADGEDDHAGEPQKKRARKSNKNSSQLQGRQVGKDDKENRLDQKQVQARFISGVAELQFMGFIKPTNRKTDHVQRLTWGNI